MGWDMEETKKKNESDKIFKVLTAFIIMILILIGAIIAMLYYVKNNTFTLTVDGVSKKYSDKLIKKQNDINYINIEEFTKLVGYNYHGGEYKEYSQDLDKCYIESTQETTSFYLNSNKICKLPVGAYDENYKVFSCKYNTMKIDDEFYAPVETMRKACNVSIDLNTKKMEILTLPHIVKTVEGKINPDPQKPIYTSLQTEEFENQKGVLYGYIIASKKDSALYSVKNLETQKEIISDKYKKIMFIEETKEFLVTNSVNKVGIIDENGQNKIEQIYDSIKVINTNPRLYLMEENGKQGVINQDGTVVLHAEYDKIGIDNTKYNNIQNQYVLLNSVIPVQKDGKYGLVTIEGNQILDVKYDSIGCEKKTVKLGENYEKIVTPVAEIDECNGIVIKNGENYDLYLLDIKQLITLKVTSIYSVRENGKIEYYMVYKGNEMSLMENLKKLGYIKETKSEETTNTENTVNNNSVVSNTTNTVENTGTNNIVNTVTNIQQTSVVNQSTSQVNNTLNQ